MKRRYFWDKIAKEWVEYRPRASSRQSVHVISDNLDGVLNPADGKRYDSKSAYYAAVKAAGCEIIGNDAPREASRRDSYDRAELRSRLKAAWERHS